MLRISQKRFSREKFRNKRPVGKPRTRWEDVVRRETSQILEIRGWRRRAADREEWRRRPRGAQGPEGAAAPQMAGHVLDRISQSSGSYKIKEQVQCSYM